MDNVYIHEFLYRNNAKENPVNGDTWHVVLARDSTDIWGNPATELFGPMTPAQAAKLGFTLKTILSDINQEAVTQAAAAKAVRDERDQAVFEKDVAEAESEKTREVLSTVQSAILERDNQVQALVDETSKTIGGLLKRAETAEARVSELTTDNDNESGTTTPEA